MDEYGSHKKELIKYWLDKAKESLDSAKSEIDANRITFAVNRLYYALFYAFSAVLISKGKSYSKHSVVRSEFHRSFVKPGIIDKKTGRLYDELFNARHQGDYVPMIDFDKDIVVAQYEDIKMVLPKFEELVELYQKGK